MSKEKTERRASYMGVVIPYKSSSERYIKALNLYLYMVMGDILPMREAQVMAMYLQFGYSDTTKRMVRSTLQVRGRDGSSKAMTSKFLNKINHTLVGKGLLVRQEGSEGDSYLELSKGMLGLQEHIKGGVSTPNFIVKFKVS